ncbi:hypothetical protein I7I51_07852 [Histoplasma capsulatum]|uniref:Uncharacterized protein n=1 Tax=Ajellomyces capsulatus TaxID=5037 RepID=A0A8A1LW95_AJECA|nr:hypothetical protein I7I51_07852 [Histoplasma capsulatum]
MSGTDRHDLAINGLSVLHDRPILECLTEAGRPVNNLSRVRSQRLLRVSNSLRRLGALGTCWLALHCMFRVLQRAPYDSPACGDFILLESFRQLLQPSPSFSSLARQQEGKKRDKNQSLLPSIFVQKPKNRKALQILP